MHHRLDFGAMIRLLLTGDVMTGRGIDQAFRDSCDPALHESWVRDARMYLRLAEDRNGPIRTPVDHRYIWGAALDAIERLSPHAFVINLETSITESDAYCRQKGIHYRMHPNNVRCLTAAGVDCCVLANNHVLDWGRTGLADTLAMLTDACIGMAGAGRHASEAAAPDIIDLSPRARVLVFGYGDSSSGIPDDWRADARRAGVNLLDDVSHDGAQRVSASILAHRKPTDIVIVSIHWGSNWGYHVMPEYRAFARSLIDSGAADIVHGHSSHHPRPVEIYRDKPILYGCGDLINDYEGISGHEEYRGDLSFLYAVDFDAGTRAVQRIELVPMRIRRFRLEHATAADTAWLMETMNRENRKLGAAQIAAAGDSLLLRW